MKFLSSILGLALLVLSVIFAVSNRLPVTASLWPFDLEITAPLYVMVLGALATGLVLGATLVWLQHVPHRFKARRLGKDIVVLSDKIMDLEEELEQYRAEKAALAPPLLPSPKWQFWKRLIPTKP